MDPGRDLPRHARHHALADAGLRAGPDPGFPRWGHVLETVEKRGECCRVRRSGGLACAVRLHLARQHRTPAQGLDLGRGREPGQWARGAVSQRSVVSSVLARSDEAADECDPDGAESVTSMTAGTPKGAKGVPVPPMPPFCFRSPGSSESRREFSESPAAAAYGFSTTLGTGSAPRASGVPPRSC